MSLSIDCPNKSPKINSAYVAMVQYSTCSGWLKSPIRESRLCRVKEQPVLDLFKACTPGGSSCSIDNALTDVLNRDELINACPKMTENRCLFVQVHYECVGKSI